jgi:hypothetical protein
MTFYLIHVGHILKNKFLDSKNNLRDRTICCDHIRIGGIAPRLNVLPKEKYDEYETIEGRNRKSDNGVKNGSKSSMNHKLLNFFYSGSSIHLVTV